MDIGFRSGKLKKILGSEKEINRRYGQMAKVIKNRMAVLAAAPTLAHVPAMRPVRCHQLSADRDEDFSVDLKDPDRLTFRVANDPIPRLADGGIDRTKVTAITILDVEDTHK